MVEEPKPHRLAVIGSAHLDVLSHVREHRDTVDRPGDMIISYGGTGFNTAVNLATYHHHVLFGTILADTMISQTIVHALQRAGVHVRAAFRPDLPEAGFSAHIDRGEMISAVASTPVEKVAFPAAQLEQIASEADGLVLECNLSTTTLISATKLAAGRGMPVWVAGVSESKALKIRSLIETGCRIDALFLNSRELRFALERLGPPWRTPRQLAQGLGGYVVETRSADGVAVWSADLDHPLRASVPAPQVLPREGHHWLGAGDHLMALTLHRHLTLGESIPDAAAVATLLVSRHHRRRHCNLGSRNPLEERMKHLTDTALRDPLTQLVNRAGLQDFVRQLGEQTPISVLLIDIDHFKRINDNFGHDVGDQVLRGMGRILKAQVRATDCACRWGGEEMIVLLPRSPLQAAAEVAERIRREVEEHEFACGRVTCSIGVAGGHLGAIDLARERADRALYEGKRSGRNRVIVDPPTEVVECSGT